MRQTLLQRCWIVLCTLAVLGSCGPTMHPSATGGIPARDDRFTFTPLRLALEALLDEPTLKSAHRASIERGLADLRAKQLPPMSGRIFAISSSTMGSQNYLAIPWMP